MDKKYHEYKGETLDIDGLMEFSVVDKKTLQNRLYSLKWEDIERALKTPMRYCDRSVEPELKAPKKQKVKPKVKLKGFKERLAHQIAKDIGFYNLNEAVRETGVSRGKLNAILNEHPKQFRLLLLGAYITMKARDSWLKD